MVMGELTQETEVLVIGGGNLALDVARTAKRLGAQEVFMACIERAEEMPANSWEIDGARMEGVQIRPSLGPAKILGKNGAVTGMDLVQCTGVFNDQGNFYPNLIPTH